MSSRAAWDARDAERGREEDWIFEDVDVFIELRSIGMTVSIRAVDMGFDR